MIVVVRVTATRVAMIDLWSILSNRDGLTVTRTRRHMRSLANGGQTDDNGDQHPGSCAEQARLEH